jgi:uncharacterized membrane protein YhaH (DUF805 family)
MDPFNWRYYLSWDGRISRRDYVVGQQVIGLAVLFLALGPFVLSMIWTPLATGGYLSVLLVVLVAAFSIPASSLLVRRAHDLGWPGALGLTPLFVLLALVLAGIARSEVFGPDASEAQWLDVATSAPLVLAMFSPASLLACWLMFKKGQSETNRYGPAPK